MKSKIKDIMSAVFEVNASDIPDTANTSNVENWDSLNHMNLVVALEQEFNITFDDEEIVQITSLDTIEKVVSRKSNL
jgi:acyl carrier protein